MDRFYLKTYVIGYEVPFLDLDDPKGQDELASNICDKYMNWFDVLDINLKVLQLPNTNYLLLFDIIVRVDTDLNTEDSINSDWDKMKSEIASVIEEFLNSRNLLYKILINK